jgi:hypothetical protein
MTGERAACGTRCILVTLLGALPHHQRAWPPGALWCFAAPPPLHATAVSPTILCTQLAQNSAKALDGMTPVKRFIC